MTEIKIPIDELAGKVLNNAITGSRIVEEGDKTRLYLDLKNQNLAIGLIGLLGKPMIYGSIGVKDPNKFNGCSKQFIENKYWFTWSARAGLEMDYQHCETSLPSRYRDDEEEDLRKWKNSNVPKFERVTVRKRMHIIRDLSVSFDYFFERDMSQPFLADVNSGIDLSSYGHSTFFSKYEGPLNEIKRGYDYCKPAFVQKIRINRTEFLKEIRKLLVSEGAFRPLLR